MPEGQSFPERLRALRQGGEEPLSPLWIEHLPVEEALAEARRREGPLFRLQEAHFLSLLNRHREAVSVLRSLGELPRGLAGLREELLASIDGSAVPVDGVGAGLSEKMMPFDDRLDCGPGPRGETTSFGGALGAWLSSVQSWRRVLDV